MSPFIFKEVLEPPYVQLMKIMWKGKKVMTKNHSVFKKTLFTVVAVVILCTSSAMAFEKPEPVQYPPSVYKCRASSDYAWGIGLGPTRGRAASRALFECAKRTPQGEVCVLDWCKRIR